jgi:hypothetical protein
MMLQKRKGRRKKERNLENRKQEKCQWRKFTPCTVWIWLLVREARCSAESNNYCNVWCDRKFAAIEQRLVEVEFGTVLQRT